MTSQVRLVAFDIDGTLFGSNKEPQPGTLRAFNAMRAAGTRIMLASGRPFPGLQAIAERCGLGSGLIFASCNGSVIVEQDSGEIIASHPFSAELSEALIGSAQEQGVMVMLPWGNELVVDQPEHPQVIHEAAGNAQTVRGVEDIARPGIAPTKILFTSPERADLERLEGILRASFGSRIELSFSSKIYMEATIKGVDKSSALRDYAFSQGIDLAETMAFGDNGNDVTMLRTAGLGVAMGNGIPEAKAAADRVTTSNDDEGIARVLREYFDFELAETPSMSVGD